MPHPHCETERERERERDSRLTQAHRYTPTPVHYCPGPANNGSIVQLWRPDTAATGCYHSVIETTAAPAGRRSQRTRPMTLTGDDWQGRIAHRRADKVHVVICESARVL